MPDDQPISEPFDEHDEQAERVRWFYSTRVDAEGNVPQGLIARASAQKRNMARRLADGLDAPIFAVPGGPESVNWTPLGPSVITHGQASHSPAVNGRFTALAVGPGGSRIYAGAANGGVWFSGDDGMNWVPLDDYSTSPTFTSHMDADSLSVGAIAVQFKDSASNDVLFVGTGEPQSRVDKPEVDIGGGYFGVGVRYSASGGAAESWHREATNLAGHGFFKIIIDPADSTLVYAATTYGLYQRPTTGSSFTTWNLLESSAFTKNTAAASDIIIAGAGTTKHYYAAFWGDKVYRSPDGSSWTAISGISGTGRIVLAAGENDTTVIYALDGGNGNLYRLDSGTNGNFQPVTGVPKALFFGNQGNYDIVLAVDPSNVNTVYLGGDLTWDGSWTLSFYKGTITGGPGTYIFPFNNANDLFMDSSNKPDSSKVPSDATWIGTGIHPDIHALAFATNLEGKHNGSIVWVGTDGGLFRSTESGSIGTFKARNTGLAVVEMTYLAQHPQIESVLFAGCQDNGTLRYWGEQAWHEAPQGDGGGVAINPMYPNKVMSQYIKSNLSISTVSKDGSATNEWKGLTFPPRMSDTTEQMTAAETEKNSTNFYSPIAVFSYNTAVGVTITLAAFGTNRLWFTSDWGTTWATLPTKTNPYDSANTDAQLILGQDVLDGTPIKALAVGGENDIVAATQNQVWWFTNTQTATGWVQKKITIEGLPPNPIITALAVEDSTKRSFYITLGGSDIDHIWYFDGSDWQSAGLAVDTLDVPTHAVVIDPAHSENLYIGTDVGCWKGIKTGSSSWTWSAFSQGLPESAITDLAIHPSSRLLRAATHGRGVWEIPLDATSGEDPDIYLRASADSGRMQGGQRIIHTLPSGLVWYPDIGWWPNDYDNGLFASADIKIRRGSRAANLSPLNDPPNYLDFAENIGAIITDYGRQNIAPILTMTADKSGNNQVFIQVHNRGHTPVDGKQVWVLLLLSASPIVPASPKIPSSYANRINQLDTSTTWPDTLIQGGVKWVFADPENPYRTLPGPLDVRTPQVVEYNIDFLKTPPVTFTYHRARQNCLFLLAFVTTKNPNEQVKLTDDGTLQESVKHDKHIAVRLIQLV